MQLREFGNTGIQVSALGFGAGHIGSPQQSEEDVAALLNTVLDLGINVIDTAPGYGLSEQRIGRHLSRRRGDFVLVTKCGYGVEGIADWTPECIERGVEQALRTMKTDVIDVMLFHSCPRNVLEHHGIVAALLRCVQKGKVRAAGYSGENDDIDWAACMTELRAFETSVNLFDQRSLDRYIPTAVAKGAGIIAKRPIGNAPWRFPEQPRGNYAEEYWLRCRAMGIAPPAGMEWSEFAIRFAAFAPGVSTAIVGTSNPKHLAELAAATARGPLDAKTAASARDLFRRCDRMWLGQV